MITKTWPYGTVRKATLIDYQQMTSDGLPLPLIILDDELGEGHIILGETTTAKIGDQVTLTFTKGGPTGGYWRVTP